MMHLAVSSSLSCHVRRKASLQWRAASKKKRQCQGSRGGECRRAPTANSWPCWSRPFPERERDKEEEVEEAADVVALLLWLCPLPFAARMSPLELPCRELLSDKEEQPRLLLLPGGRPGPRICGTHLMPLEVQIWQGLRRLHRFYEGIWK